MEMYKYFSRAMERSRAEMSSGGKEARHAVKMD